MKDKKIYIGSQRCKIFDEFNLNICYNCCNYNHNSKKCTNDKKCPKCAEKHTLDECKSSIL